MAITAGQVKELREKTGVGMMECKKALEESAGDMEKAIVWLRERGMSRAAKKADRIAAEGTVFVQISPDKSTGVVIEVNCETDFAGKNADFVKFVEEAATLALSENLPSVEAMLETKMSNGETVANTLTALIAKIGENLKLRRVSVISAKNGVVGGYIHMGGKIGTLVALDGAKGAAVEDLAKDLAMHVAAASPRYLESSEVDTTELDQERAIARKKLEEEGKPAEMIEKILVGQMQKFFKEVCLLEQQYVKDPNTNITKLLKASGHPVTLSAFRRFGLGEGIEKKQENFADEVAATMRGN